MNKQDQIGQYLRDGQKGREANRLEREALSDPFLYEALEGLTTVDGEHEEVVMKLQGRLKGKASVRRRRMPVYWWAAASLLLVGGVALWLLRGPEEEIQMTEVPWMTDSLEVVHPVVELAKEEKAEPVADRKRIASGSDEVRADQMVMEEVCDVKVVARSARAVVATSAPVRMERIVRGLVVDSVGNALPGVTVFSGKQGSATDQWGRFQFKADDTVRQLTASYIGMKSRNYTVPDSGDMRITMSPDDLALSEVVVTGLMAKRRTSLVGSVTTVQTGNNWAPVFYRYVADSLRYPADALSRKIEGEVVLSLNFNRKGKLGRIRVVQKLFPSCDREAVRIVEDYPGPWDIRKENVIVRIPFRLKRER